MPAQVAQSGPILLPLLWSAGGALLGGLLVGIWGRWRRQSHSAVRPDSAAQTVPDESPLAGSPRDLAAARSSPVRATESEADPTQRLPVFQRIAGGVAHDLNNALTAIGGNLDLLRDELAQSSPNTAYVQRSLDEIQRAGAHAAALGRALLVTGTRPPLPATPQDVNKVVERIAKLLRRILTADVGFQFAASSTPAVLPLDPNRLESLLFLVCADAAGWDPRPAGVELRLTSGTNGAAGNLCLVISVTGRPPGGAAARWQAWAGDLDWSTEIVDDGKLTLRVLLTVGGDTALGATAAAGRTPVPREIVLVCEDDEAVRESVMDLLLRDGHEVIEAPDADAVDAQLATLEQPPTVLLTDVVLPGRCGKQLAERLTATWPELRVVYMSGYDRAELERHGIEVDAAELLAKPFTPAQLRDKVTQVVARP